MSDDDDVIRLAIGSRLELLALVHDIIEGLAREHGLDGETTMAIEVAVIEAGTNAIQHGNVFAKNKAVTFEFQVRNGGIEIQVDDFGEGFDPSRVANPTEGEALLSPHGRGLFLMRSLMDEASFDTRPDHGTRVHLRKALPGV